MVFCGCSQISAYATYRKINITRTQQIQGGPLRQADGGRNGNMDLELENSKGVSWNGALLLGLKMRIGDCEVHSPNNHEKDGRHDECYHRLTLDMDESECGVQA
jgi:hypothetical protein